MKIKPTNTFTHEELATVFMANYSYPRKFNPRNIVTAKICTFRVHFLHTPRKIPVVYNIFWGNFWKSEVHNNYKEATKGTNVNESNTCS